jgi:chromosome segregation ATPase
MVDCIKNEFNSITSLIAEQAVAINNDTVQIEQLKVELDAAKAELADIKAALTQLNEKWNRHVSNQDAFSTYRAV